MILYGRLTGQIASLSSVKNFVIGFVLIPEVVTSLRLDAAQNVQHMLMHYYCMANSKQRLLNFLGRF